MFLAVRCTITGRFRVCHNKRITRNKMFRDYAERGKSTMRWCFGFKLHLICNERGELLNFTLYGDKSINKCKSHVYRYIGKIESRRIRLIAQYRVHNPYK